MFACKRFLGQGNVGDSRAIASVKGAVEQLSSDHKPGNEDETKRIIAAGGWVEFNRVNGRYDQRYMYWFCLMLRLPVKHVLITFRTVQG